MPCPSDSGSNLISTAALLRAFDEALASLSGMARARAETGFAQIACRQGCAFCCYQKIVVTVAAGTLIYLYLQQSKRWVPQTIAVLSEADRRMTNDSHPQYVARRQPCPFLLEEGGAVGRGACTIYPVRPIACAATVSVTDDPARCIDTPGAALKFSSPDVDAWSSEFYANALGDRRLVELLCTLPGAVLVGAALREGRPPPRDVWVCDQRTIPPTLTGDARTTYLDAHCRAFRPSPPAP
jgi:Fe-S-cluster containining protein